MTAAPRQRADRLLVERGLFESRAKAQAAIEAGLVTANDAAVRKASEEIPVDAQLQATAAHPYVSRGGVKLAAALDHFGFDPRGRVCLDVGASTGGFTQVLLERGARRVYAVDVGRGQLHDSLRARPEVRVAGRDRHPQMLPGHVPRDAESGHRRRQLHFAEIGAAARRSSWSRTAPNWWR